MSYKFRIPVGDWSGDGHSRCDWYIASANAPIDVVREAFFSAAEQYPEVDPQTFCSGYEEGTLPEDVRERLAKMGAPLPESEEFDTEDMARVIVWFINLGDPSLKVNLSPADQVPMLPFYGYDDKQRHISPIGYGLL